MICDEALSSLDISVRAQIVNLLLDLRDELSISYFFIAHDLSLVRMLCDEVIVLYKSKIVEMGPCDQVLLSPQEEYTKRLIASELMTFDES